MTTVFELRETKIFFPVLLYKKDLFELEKILSDSFTHSWDSMDIKLTHKEKSYQVSNFNELFQIDDLPQVTNKLSISRNGWIEKDGKNIINRGLTLTFYYNFVHCDIHSYDQDWYNGKLSRIKSFLKKRKPWYAILNQISFIYPTIAIASLIYGVKVFKTNSLLPATAPLLLFITMLIISILTPLQKIFPYVKICLKDKKKYNFGLNEFNLIIVLLASVLTIFQILYNFLNGKID